MLHLLSVREQRDVIETEQLGSRATQRQDQQLQIKPYY